MRYGLIAGVEKPVSRLVMGSMVFHTDRIPYSFGLLDEFLEIGGTAIDTAYVYAGGESEKVVGRWIRERGIRDRIVVIAKGAATMEATPEIVTRELIVSLDRFGLESADVYLMHRDNPTVPVGEFVDVLNEHRAAGRFTAFGGSNWEPERLQAANEYAAAKGLQGFSASSPNFSLAHWNEPMWGGCTAAVAPDVRDWYQETQMALLAWSSQANGFFTGGFSKDDRSNSEIVRVWYNDANFERLRRAQELAEKKGVSSLQIALAYVLDQPMNIFALIGPRNSLELQTSAQALDVCLTPEELAWLNLEA